MQHKLLYPGFFIRPDWGSISCTTFAEDEANDKPADFVDVLPKDVRREHITLDYDEAEVQSMAQSSCLVHRRLVLRFYGPSMVHMIASGAVRRLVRSYFSTDLLRQLASSQPPIEGMAALLQNSRPCDYVGAPDTASEADYRTRAPSLVSANATAGRTL